MLVELPEFLDDFIYKDLGGYYATMRNTGCNVDMNLRNDEELNKKYIGTYFPRSCAEAYCIFYDLFLNENIKNKFSNHNEINILDVGAGTGGNIFGLLYAVKELLPNIKNINIVSIEGNSNAIEYQKKFVELFNKNFGYDVNLITLEKVFTIENYNNEICELLMGSGKTNFDIIMTFKFISELYNSDLEKAKCSFEKFLDLSGKYLSDFGLVLILDVNSNNTKTYTSIILNNNIANYLKKPESILKPILPLSCAFYHNECNNSSCFTQNIYYVKHSKAKMDGSKVCFSVFAKNDFAYIILNDIKKIKVYNTVYQPYGITGCCEFGKSHWCSSTGPSAYQINSK